MRFFRKILMFTLLIGSAAFVFGAVMKKPYLIFEGNNASMTVMWQLDAAANCTIEWGSTTSYGNSVNDIPAGPDNLYTYTRRP